MNKSIHSREYRILTELMREARERSGLTQIDVADRLGQTQSYISKVERGERRLDLVQLRGYCEAVGLPLPELVASFEAKVSGKRR